MSFGPGHLAEHPLPPGIVGALGLGGYQLLVDVGGVGAGRLGSHGVPARRARARSVPAGRRHPALAPPAAAEGRARGLGVHAARGAARLPASIGLSPGARTRRSAQQGQPRQPRHRRRSSRRSPTSSQADCSAVGRTRRACSRPCAVSHPPARLRTSRAPNCCARYCWRSRCATSRSVAPRPPIWPTAHSSWRAKAAAWTRRRRSRPQSRTAGPSRVTTTSIPATTRSSQSPNDTRQASAPMVTAASCEFDRSNE